MFCVRSRWSVLLYTICVRAGTLGHATASDTRKVYELECEGFGRDTEYITFAQHKS